MPDNESAPPEGSGTEAEEAAWEMATAETLRGRGELAEAATWYRRAANHLMEAGDDERAISVAKLAAELAALDDAGRPSQSRAAASEPVRSATEAAARATAARIEAARAPSFSSAQETNRAPPPASNNKNLLPWQKGDRAQPPKGSQLPEARTSPANSSAKSALPAPGRSDTLGPPQRPSSATRAAVGTTSGAAVNVLGKSSAAHARPAVAPPRSSQAIPGGEIQDATHRIDLGEIVSPLAAMLDEAVSHIESVPQAPLSGAPKGSQSRRPLSYMPARIAEADLIATRLPALPLFSDLPNDRVREVAKQMGIVRFKAGELLCESGAPEGPLYVIIEGAAWVGLAGDDAPAAIVTAGDFVGEITSMYGGPRTASVLAQGSLEAVALPPSLVRSLAREFESFRDALLEAARERMAESLPRLAPIFRRFEAFERKDVFAAFEILPVSEGSQLLCEGEVADGIYIVAAGEVELYGGEFGIARAPRARVGEALGVSSTITGEPSGVSARAARDMLVAKLTRDKYDDLASRFPSLAAALGDVGTPGRGVTC